MIPRFTKGFMFALGIVFFVSGCGLSDRDIKEDFAKRIDYLRTMPHVSDTPYFGGYEYDISKTDSITKPYRAEVSYANYEKRDKRYQPVVEYRATLTRSDEKEAMWELQSLKEKSVWLESEIYTSEWKDSPEEYLWTSFFNIPMKQIKKEMKKREDQRERSRKVQRRLYEAAEKAKTHRKSTGAD